MQQTFKVQLMLFVLSYYRRFLVMNDAYNGTFSLTTSPPAQFFVLTLLRQNIRDLNLFKEEVITTCQLDWQDIFITNLSVKNIRSFFFFSFTFLVLQKSSMKLQKRFLSGCSDYFPQPHSHSCLIQLEVLLKVSVISPYQQSLFLLLWPRIILFPLYTFLRNLGLLK